MRPTIYALSSGRPPAGVAVVRVSGERVRAVLEALTGSVPRPRMASYGAVRDPAEGSAIDRGLVLFFPGPASFTGEDVAELHLHGGRAVVAALLAVLERMPGLRPAEAGEFTRRAFENGRMDLTAVEGLADLIAAETEAQRRQALRLADGVFARRAEGWREGILAARAAIEADLDFSDEEDVPGSVADGAFARAAAVRADIAAVLEEGNRGERVREGFEVALMGRPNAGKSSLLNALARRDVAIVTDIPGTTRDPIEVHLDLAGQAVTVVDTAGLRDSADLVEREGVRRAVARGERADLVLWLDDEGVPPPGAVTASGVPVIRLRSKVDRLASPEAVDAAEVAVSALTGAGLDRLVERIARLASESLSGEPALVTRARQRRCLVEAEMELGAALRPGLPLEVAADHLRRASDAIGRLTGRIDVEDVLGAIFSSFCIGK